MVRGYALAGGFGLACACDLLVAADDAVFGTPEIDIGLWPYMITVPLLRSVPPKRLLELMMTGRRVDAREALDIGIATEVVPVGELDSAVDRLAATLAAKPPLALRWGRESFYRTLAASNDADAARVSAHDADGHHQHRRRRGRRRRVRREARAALDRSLTV